jgi:putative transposase
LKSKIKENKHRLSLNFYKGNVITTFTICILDRKPVFKYQYIVNEFANFLKESAEKYNCEILAYCFMPDHLHVTIKGSDENSDLYSAIVRFKQKSGYFLSRNIKYVRWQKDFYDHILRKDDDLERHIFYILGNPVRKNLVDAWDKYPFSWSILAQAKACGYR